MGRLKRQSRADVPDKSYLTALRIIFIISFLLAGLYYELTAALASVALLVLLLWKNHRDYLRIHINDALIAAVAVSLFYFLSALWAVDGGLALWGGVKYLPILLFGLCLTQADRDGRRVLLGDLPWIGAAMTILSFVLQFVPRFQDIFSVSGRLAGFFQYPNTFACFLLLGLEILLMEGRDYRYRLARPVCGIILVFGLMQAGSRTIFIIAVPAVVVSLLVKREKKALLTGIISVVCGAVAGFAVGSIGNIGGAGRVLDISSNASTMLGRFLYWKDALPVILQHPFGLGYLGYYFTQGSFQTGVYTVRWVHNDLLQLMLDVGWIPAVLMVIALVRALMSKGTRALERVLIVTMAVHCLVDFDLEFVAMWFILLICLDWDEFKERTFNMRMAAGCIVTAVLGVFSLYIGVGSTLTYAGSDAAAVRIYPWNTLSLTELLTQTDDVDELSVLADRILSRNSEVALAWDARALADYSDGDFGQMITDKRQAISLARYELSEYEDYFEKLRQGYTLYLQAGDTGSAQICLAEIEGIRTMLDEVREGTDPLAWELADTPELDMPDSYQVFLEETADITE